MYQRKTIICPKCGKDSGINDGPLWMVIPHGGLKCSCGYILIQGDNISWKVSQETNWENLNNGANFVY